MDIQEITLESLIEYNNEWPECELKLQSTIDFENRLKDKKIKQLLVPMQLDKEKALNLFGTHKDIAKIFSMSLDALDVLPLHPDIAFDVIWRTLEITLKYLSIKSWSYEANRAFGDVLKKGCDDVLTPYCVSDEKISNMFEYLLGKTSLISLRYLVARLYFKMDLSVSPQVTFVRERANDLLGEEIIQAIKDKYVNKDGRMDADNQRKAARLFLLILKGAEVDVNGYKMKPLDLPKRIEFYTSCVVYSSRCERFHGDYYSPLKSSLTDMGTYYEYYYLMTFSYALWGIMMNKTQSVVGGQIGRAHV